MVGAPIIQCFFYADTALKAESMADEDLLDNFKITLTTHLPKEEVMAAKIVEYKITQWTTDVDVFRKATVNPVLIHVQRWWWSVWWCLWSWWCALVFGCLCFPFWWFFA